MFCISVSYKKAPLSIRQQFAFSATEQLELLNALCGKGEITGGVVLSTCNRSEIYVTGGGHAFETVEAALETQKGIDREQIKTCCLYYRDKKAVRHLFQVACGLDSMVLGEDEILHQLKEAYRIASENGYVNSELNIIFQKAFHCAKRSKAATRLSTTPVSVGTLTANAIEDYLSEKKSGQVLVIGAAGKIGSIVAKDLLAKGISVIGTQRRKHQGEEIFLTDRQQLRMVDFHERYQYISCVDAIVSATSSPHYTLTRGEYEKYCRGEGQLLIDLAVPNDIDKAIGELDGNILYDIDYFRLLSRKNNQAKYKEACKAEEILEECVEELMKSLYIKEFHACLEEKPEEEWFPKMIYYLKEVLDSEELLRVLDKIKEKKEAI